MNVTCQNEQEVSADNLSYTENTPASYWAELQGTTTFNYLLAESLLHSLGKCHVFYTVKLRQQNLLTWKLW